MPATQRGEVYPLGAKRYGIRYYGPDGKRRKQSPFPSRSAAFTWFRDHIEPQLRGDVAAKPDVNLREFIEIYLDRHEAGVRPRTIATLRERLGHAETRFGDVPLHSLERMV